MRAGRCRKALLVNCECNVEEHCVFDIPGLDSLDHLLPGLTIGEAATATVLTDDMPDDGYLALFKTWGAHHGLCKIPLPNQEQYRMDPEEDEHEPLRFFAYGSTLVRVTMRRVVETYLADPGSGRCVPTSASATR
jgi:hypothetical protein